VQPAVADGQLLDLAVQHHLLMRVSHGLAAQLQLLTQVVLLEQCLLSESLRVTDVVPLPQWIEVFCEGFVKDCCVLIETQQAEKSGKVILAYNLAITSQKMVDWR
jgi:hypothetical protein